MFLSRTKALFEKLVNDIKKVIAFSTIIINLILLAFYAFSIYNNIDNLVFLIIYSILAVISIVIVVATISTINKTPNKTFNHTIKFIKYFANGTIVAVNACEMAMYSTTDLSLIFLIASAISLLVQIIFEFVLIFAEQYCESFKVALEKDFKFVLDIAKKVDKLKQTKGNFWELLDAPFELIANLLEKKDKTETTETASTVSPVEEKVEQLREDYIDKDNARINAESEENAKKQKKELKEHIKTIKNGIVKFLFKKKSKPSDEE